MRKQTAPTVLPELRALDAYRLEHDLTFDALRAEMADADCPIGRNVLNVLIGSQLPNGRRPRDRTLYKIRKFLAGLGKTQRTRVRARRAFESATN